MSNKNEEFMINNRQMDYEKRRRGRMLGLSIDQSLQGIKNIIMYGDPKFWPEDDKAKWEWIKSKAEDILVHLMELERNMSSVEDIYASMIPKTEKQKE